jgi:hypothetical protein
MEKQYLRQTAEMGKNEVKAKKLTIDFKAISANNDSKPKRRRC